MSEQRRQRDKKYIPASKVWRDRYGVTPMTGWRWERDPGLGFPKPYYMGRFKFFAEDELELTDSGSLETRSRTFRRYRDALVEKGLVGHIDGFAWVVPQ